MSTCYCVNNIFNYVQANNFGIEGAEAMKNALKKNSAITKLWLWSRLYLYFYLLSFLFSFVACNINGAMVVTALSEALKVNSTITEIYLRRE